MLFFSFFFCFCFFFFWKWLVIPVNLIWMRCLVEIEKALTMSGWSFVTNRVPKWRKSDFFLSLLRAIDLATKQKEEKGRSFRNRRLMQHTGVIVETEESEMESPNSGDINRKSGVHASDTGESVDHHPFPILLAFTKTEILGTIPSSFRFSSLNLSFLLYFFISFYFFKNAIRDVTRFSEHAHYS